MGVGQGAVEAGMNLDYWRGRRVMITGHTGFKGSWLTVLMRVLGAEVCGYSLNPPTNPAMFDQIRGSELCEDVRGDIRDMPRLVEAMRRFKPEFLFHLAAQPIVLAAREQGIETIDINVRGTASVLESARSIQSLRSIVSVTTDKVYRNVEWYWPYRETDALGGHEPYGASKACAEIVTEAWAHSFLEPSGIRVGAARAGNVIGGGDWAQARLVPDIVRAWSAKQPLVIRSPKSVRPWQHVLEPLMGYVMYAHGLAENAQATPRGLNFGPADADAQPVEAICRMANSNLEDPVKVVVEGSGVSFESKLLRLDSSLAAGTLGWRPRLDLERGIAWTLKWYVQTARGADARACCMSQIEEFLAMR